MTWFLLNLTDKSSTNATVQSIHPSWPFVFIDSQPAVPRTIAGGHTLELTLAVGVPRSPGHYVLTIVFEITE